MRSTVASEESSLEVHPYNAHISLVRSANCLAMVEVRGRLGTSKRAVPIHLESDEVRVADHHSPGSGQLVDSLELTESVQMTDAEARKHGSPYHAQYKRTLY